MSHKETAPLSSPTFQRLGVIGAGGIATTLLSALPDALPAPVEALSVLVEPGMTDSARALIDRLDPRVARKTFVRDHFEAFLADAPDCVAECAGHGAVKAYGETILAGGADFAMVSIGSLADAALYDALQAAAAKSGAQLILAAGAIGAIDVLGAARLSGLESVTYRGRKPPKAWRGTPAASLLDLDTLREPTTFFTGTSREAAQTYPQNANVAATVALAGLGFDGTRVELVADPSIELNIHELHVRSACASFSITLEGRPSPINPKTSMTAGYSLAREIVNRTRAVVI